MDGCISVMAFMFRRRLVRGVGMQDEEACSTIVPPHTAMDILLAMVIFR